MTEFAFSWKQIKVKVAYHIARCCIFNTKLQNKKIKQPCFWAYKRFAIITGDNYYVLGFVDKTLKLAPNTKWFPLTLHFTLFLPSLVCHQYIFSFKFSYWAFSRDSVFSGFGGTKLNEYDYFILMKKYFVFAKCYRNLKKKKNHPDLQTKIFPDLKSPRHDNQPLLSKWAYAPLLKSVFYGRTQGSGRYRAYKNPFSLLLFLSFRTWQENGYLKHLIQR